MKRPTIAPAARAVPELLAGAYLIACAAQVPVAGFLGALVTFGFVASGCVFSYSGVIDVLSLVFPNLRRY